MRPSSPLWRERWFFGSSTTSLGASHWLGLAQGVCAYSHKSIHKSVLILRLGAWQGSRCRQREPRAVKPQSRKTCNSTRPLDDNTKVQHKDKNSKRELPLLIRKRIFKRITKTQKKADRSTKGVHARNLESGAAPSPVTCDRDKRER